MMYSVQNLSSPLRIDSYIFEALRAEHPDLADQIPSRALVQSLIESGNVLLNGKAVKKNAKVANGDRIQIAVVQRPLAQVEPENIPIKIVYEDEDLMVIDKERGMVVHPAIGNYSGTLVNAILYHIKNKAEEAFFQEHLNIKNESVRPGIVHRIDKDTTGLLMIAKNDRAHAKLAEQLKDRTVTRRYVALVHGGFKDDEGFVDAPIKRDKRDGLKMAVDPAGKRAVTHYKVLERFRSSTLLELRLETGRTHQIRVHMKHIKHPVLGDPLYGTKTCKYAGMGQLLHAKTLGFVHPASGEYLEFHAPIPDDFQAVIDKEREYAK